MPLRPGDRGKLIATLENEEIHGRDVVLVPLRAGDAGELAGLLDDALVRDALAVADVDGLARRFARWETRRSPDGAQLWLNWIVRAREGGRALGWAQATVEAPTASVAYALLPAERSRGAASDAARAMVAWLRTTVGVEEVTASIAPENTASERVARAAGFELTDRRVEGERVWRQAGPAEPGA
jgi:RimJ/RimL family protein N-acetyltransferase